MADQKSGNNNASSTGGFVTQSGFWYGAASNGAWRGTAGLNELNKVQNGNSQQLSTMYHQKLAEVLQQQQEFLKNFQEQREAQEKILKEALAKKEKAEKAAKTRGSTTEEESETIKAYTELEKAFKAWEAGQQQQTEQFSEDLGGFISDLTAALEVGKASSDGSEETKEVLKQAEGLIEGLKKVKTAAVTAVGAGPKSKEMEDFSGELKNVTTSLTSMSDASHEVTTDLGSLSSTLREFNESEFFDANRMLANVQEIMDKQARASAIAQHKFNVEVQQEYAADMASIVQRRLEALGPDATEEQKQKTTAQIVTALHRSGEGEGASSTEVLKAIEAFAAGDATLDDPTHQRGLMTYLREKDTDYGSKQSALEAAQAEKTELEGQKDLSEEQKARLKELTGGLLEQLQREANAAYVKAGATFAKSLTEDTVDNIHKEYDIRIEEEERLSVVRKVAEEHVKQKRIEANKRLADEASKGVFAKYEIERRLRKKEEKEARLTEKQIADRAKKEKDRKTDAERLRTLRDTKQAGGKLSGKDQREELWLSFKEFGLSLKKSASDFRGLFGKDSALGKSINTLADNKAAKKDLDYARSKEYENNFKAELRKQNADLTDDELEALYQEDLNEKEKSLREQAEKTSALLNSYLAALASDAKEVASQKSKADTILQGVSEDVIKTKRGSYWEAIDWTIGSNIGVNPLFKQKDVAEKTMSLIERGIAFNVEQRGFLESIKDRIATTFETADATLLKLVRIQQADTTAARLGMESALTGFLNSMYATTEYMKEAASSVRASLYKATSLMEASDATEFEFQVQKWLGSMYSVGFENAQNIADVLGKVAAGDIGGITEGGLGNLLVMAANEASLPISEILEKGLDANQTNKLFNEMVKYLAGIYEQTGESKVLSQQFAQVYGLTATDLKAAASLSKSLNTIASDDWNYSTQDMLNRLTMMSHTIGARTSTADKFQNLKDNFLYSMAASLGKNPVLFGLNSMANMLNDVVGGINIPFINIFGSGFSLGKVADLMNVAALSGSVLGGLGKMIAGLGNLGAGDKMLKAFGVSTGKIDVLTRGTGTATLTTQGGADVGQSGLIGNESGEDIKNKTIQDASEEPNKQIVEATEEKESKEENRHQQVVGNIVEIYKLLQDVCAGAQKFHVQLEVGNKPAAWSSGVWN